ncbi:FecR domain-containing protein [Legionella sp. km772]|uniref:FecR family protein n=1 Tax=Legionella sp. km772 TaxID=2498111 RepID=UPI000F8E6CF0|nr:FecR family protein [Legionella sp. km772]RUR05051.1 hypothetical protein ELY15_14785 [Legionella sp. km772]
MTKLISLLLLLFISPILSASVGTVLFTVKKVIAQNAGVSRNLNRGSALEVGDVIITAADSSAKIKYNNGTLVTIGSDSNYKIVAYAPSQEEVLKADLSKGKIESQTNGGAKKEALKTPVVALAITGTKYKVYVPNNKKANVKLIEGVIKIGNKVLRPGESIVATMYGITPAPYPAAGNIIAPPEMSSINSSSASTSTTGTAGSTSQASGAATTSFVNTTTIVSQTTAANTSIAAAQQTAPFTIDCFNTLPSAIIASH